LEAESDTRLKFRIIEETLAQGNNLLNTGELCDTAGVSRSGYYNWQANTKPNQIKREIRDAELFDKVLIGYNAHGYSKGYRGIHMYWLHEGVNMNCKQIRRLMNKYGLHCPKHQRNPYKWSNKEFREHAIKSNLLKRRFRDFGPRVVLLTDVTYFFYDGHKKCAYLSVIKDGCTKEILAYQLSDSLKADFVVATIEMLVSNHGISLNENTLIHSDQGVQYTSKKFRDIVSDSDIRQSMSRRGNCWDNAPQESFFGHMKIDNEDKVATCQTFSQLKVIVDDYMDYYNNKRYQMDLAKLSPVEYYQFVTTGIYPLSKVLPTPPIPEWESADEAFVDTEDETPPQE
jgi:transposase InsO family protein